MLLFAVVHAEPARTDPGAPPLAAEREAREHLRRCPTTSLALLLPGAAHLCWGRRAEGIGLLSLTATELIGGAAIVALTEAEPDVGLLESGRWTFVLAATEPLIYSQFDVLLEVQRARGLPYVPLDRPGDLFYGILRNQGVQLTMGDFLGSWGTGQLVVGQLAGRRRRAPPLP